MSFHDLHAATSGAVAGKLDLVTDEFVAPLFALLPNGPAWPREDAVLRRLVAAITVELSRVAVREGKLGRELDPATTFECVADWEASYGLPDCAQPVTLEARRAAIAAKLLAQQGHDQSEAYWIDLVKKLGYLIYWIAKGKAAVTCDDDCVDELTDEAWLFVWQIAVDHGLDDALLECLVSHNALIETFPIVHYLWQPVVVVTDPTALYGVAVGSDGYVVAVGAGGFNIHAAANAAKPDGWAPGPTLNETYAVAAVDTVFVACGAGSDNFVRSTDHGATWEAVANPTEEMYAISAGIGAGVVLAAGESGIVWRSFDSGASWALATPITGAPNVNGLTRCGDGISVFAVLACAENGHVYRTPNSGTLWIDATNAGTPLYAIAGWLLVVVAVGRSGKIIRSDDGGSTWAAVTSPTATNLRGVVGSPTGRWTAVGDGGAILQSLDNGVTWTVQTSPTTENLRAVTRHVPSNRAIIVGDSTTIILE